MPRKLFNTFASRLCFYIILLTTVIFVCIAAVFGHYASRQANNNARLYTSALLKNILDDTDLELTDVEHIVNVVESRVEESIDEPQSFPRMLIDMVGKDNLIMGGSVALEPGYYPGRPELFMEYACIGPDKKIVNKHLGGHDYDYRHMEWYRKAIDTREPSWSEPYEDSGAGNRLMTTYSVPLLDDDGKPFGVVTADVSIEELVDYIESMKPYKDGYTFIINAKGEYLSHPDSTVVLTKNVFSRAADLHSPELDTIGRRMIGRESGSAELSVNGEKMLACYAPLRFIGWSACYVCPYQSIIDSLDDVFLYVYIILIAGLLTLLAFMRHIIMRESKPMGRLTEAAYRISTGDFDAELPQIDTADEMEKLRDGFSHMQKSLKQYISWLTYATRASERIASELSIAHDIQMSLVPHSFSPFDGYPALDIHASLSPAKEVGGDFYDYTIKAGKLFFAIGDVSGKGVPAALIMAITRSRFRIFCDNVTSPAEIVAGLNNALCQENDAYMFVTMMVGVIDLADGSLRFCNAGHNPPAVIEAGRCRLLDVTPNLPIGVVDNFNYAEQRVNLGPATSLLLYTDGLTEAERADHTQLGEQRMLDCLQSCDGMTAKAIVGRLRRLVDDFVDGAEPSDDLTMMCISLTDNNR